MAIAYLSLGTNLGDKKQHLIDAVQKTEEQVGKIISLSAFHITEPWGFESENSFLNAAMGVDTPLTPFDLLSATQEIEKAMGRNRKSVNRSYTDRIIDIDLLLYDNLILETETLTLPHPLFSERLFVLEPLAEIAPNLIHPIQGLSISQLLNDYKNSVLKGRIKKTID